VTPEPKPLVEYPTVYAFKVMGRRDDGFAAWVRQLFTELMGAEVPGEAIAENVSKEGTYVSLTVSVLLVSEAQRQTIYARLHAERPRILYYL
jgi:hypothetical protein